jgi:hypothetical protein
MRFRNPVLRERHGGFDLCGDVPAARLTAGSVMAETFAAR